MPQLKRISTIVFTTITFCVLLVLFIGSNCDSTETLHHSEPLKATLPYIPDTVYFCGERVPLELFDIKESLERELLVNMYWHSQTIWFIQKSNRYFPKIESILKDFEVPDDMKYLAVAESGLAHVVSPAGATGFWQILEGTAKDYGLEVNSEVDERYNLEKATQAACKYLKESYEKYANWSTAAASYNVGRRGIDRQIEKQKESNYYDLLLNSETARYVFRLIAFKLVLESPERYNFSIYEKDLYKPIKYKEVEVDTLVASWADFAQENNTNYKMLKHLNPWLRDSKLTNKSKKTYIIRLPKKNARLLND